VRKVRRRKEKEIKSNLRREDGRINPDEIWI